MKHPPAFVDSSAIRKGIKKANLTDARSHFPHRVDISQLGSSTLEVKEWLIAHRYRSWKQKGLNGDYYQTDWKVLWFADPSKAIKFKLSLFNR